MKRITTVLGACMLLVFLCGSVSAQKVSDKNRYQPRNTETLQERGIAGALEYYRLIRGNPDVSDIISAHKAADLLPKGKALTWNEVGPDNMGGRCRAILLDRTTPTTMYAGGVAGGLWKTVTGGTSWELVAPLAENYAVSCITQDINGIIYFGTGEGFAGPAGTAAGSTGFYGGGIYKSTDNTGTSFVQIATTLPSSTSDKWALIYEMASSPNSARVYACTDGGMFFTEDGGNTWVNPVLYPGTTPYALEAHDVEVGSDGSVYAVVGDKLFYSPNGNSGTFVDRSITGVTATAAGRIEIAVAPSDPLYVYASVARSTGTLMNVYRTTDGGLTWTIIGPGGSANFNVFGDNNQGFWDNTIKVFPNDKNHILLGGIDLWDWYDGGTWIQKSLWYLESSSIYYLHADHHDIVFHPTDPNTFFHGSDGGVSKSTDGGNTFSTVNRRFITIQFYHLSSNPFGMVMGGTQDNGTIIIPGNLTTPGTAYDFLGGDGGWSAMSYIEPNTVVGTVYYGDMSRSNELGANPKAFYNDRMLNLSPAPGEGGFSGFVTPMVLDEKIYDYNSPDTVMYHADSAMAAGTVVTVHSATANYPIEYTLPVSLSAGDSIAVQDIVQARFYLGATNAVWMTKGIHDFSGAPAWFKLSTINGTAQCMAVSGCSNYLFVGTSNGRLYRISNLLAVKDSLTGDVTSPYAIVETKEIASPGRCITSISVDPNDASNVLYTLGEYGSTLTHVFYSTNALDSVVTFTNKTGDLPKMPVYSSVIEKNNPSNVIIGTELGVFSTSNITAASPSWVEDNSGMGRVPVYELHQQLINIEGSTNYGVIYAGSHGRGAFSSSSYVGIDEIESDASRSSIGIYPNPVEQFAHLQFSSLEKGNGMLNVYTIDGKLAMSKPIHIVSGSNTLDINVAQLASGNYVVEVMINNASLTGKLIKN